MRALVAALLLSQIVIDDDFGSANVTDGSRTVLHVVLPRNGLGAWNDLPPTVPAPDVAWLGSAPTVNSANEAQTFTATGAPATANSPFCSDGSWSDLSSGCMTARRFIVASGHKYDADSDFGDPGTGPMTVAAFVRRTGALNGTPSIAKRQASDTDGWTMFHDGTSACAFYLEIGANTRTARAGAAAGANNNWVLCVGVRGSDGVLTTYANGTAGTPSTALTGSLDIAGVLEIGAQNGAAGFSGDVAWAAVWPSTALTAAQVDDLYDWVAGAWDEKGAEPTFTNTGPTCCWVAGQLECFSDDFPRKGCEVPPGETGAGSPTTCAYHAHPSVTNSLLQSRTLNTTWTAVGTSVVSTSTASMFADGRQLYKVTDDDGAAHEYIHQSIAKSGTTAEICVYAMTESGAGVVTVGLQETTGTCAGAPAEVELGEIVTSTTVSGKCFARTHTDADCTSIKIVLYPVDTDSGVSATGHAAMVAEVFHGIAYAPSIYVETTTAAVTSGGDAFAAPANATLDFGGTPSGRYELSVWVTPMISDFGSATSNSIFYFGSDSAGPTNMFTLLGIGSNEAIQASMDGTAVNSAAQTWTPGTEKYVVVRGNYDSDKYQVLADGVSVATSTTATANPTAQDTVYLGARNSGVGHADGGLCLRDGRIDRP